MLSGGKGEGLGNSHVYVCLDYHSSEPEHLLEEQLGSWVEVAWIGVDIFCSVEASCVGPGQVVHGCDFKIVPVVEEDEMNKDSRYGISLGLVDEVEVEGSSLRVEGGRPEAEGEAVAGGLDATEEGHQDPLPGRKTKLKEGGPGDSFSVYVEFCNISLGTLAEVEWNEVRTSADNIAAPDVVPPGLEVILEFDGD